MRPRLGFAFSLLAACGIHAVVLLVPRVAAVAEMPIPTIELDLTATPALAGAAPVAARKLAPVQAAPITRQQLPAPIAPSEGTASAPAAEQPIEQPAASSNSAAGDGAVVPAAAAPVQLVAQPVAEAAGKPNAAPVLIQPRPQSEILPAYPRSARRAGLEGVVKVAAVVNESGIVTGVEIFITSGHAILDQAALEAVRRALFAPALQDGRPVPCRIVIPIRFQLKSQENTR